jgi:hypothetical protein
MAVLGGKAVLFGGSPSGEGGDALNDTWTWDGLAWTEEHPSHMPPKRSYHSMATLGGTVVLYGGSDGTNALADTWTWDGADWTQHVVATPPARYAAMMATLGSTVVLFGGDGGSDGETPQSDTWLWNGSAWSQPSNSNSPTGRDSGVMGSVGGKLVLFGGQDLNANAMNDVWTWDGSDWSENGDLTTVPDGRFGACGAVLAGKLVVFGGTTNVTNDFSDTWIYDGPVDARVVHDGRPGLSRRRRGSRAQARARCRAHRGRRHCTQASAWRVSSRREERCTHELPPAQAGRSGSARAQDAPVEDRDRDSLPRRDVADHRPGRDVRPGDVRARHPPDGDPPRRVPVARSAAP